MGWFSSNASKVNVNWEPLNEVAQIESALSFESDRPALFFKHSTRCSISAMALSRFEKEWTGEADCRLLFLDLLQYRGLSNLIAERTGVIHESPQAILVLKGKVVYSSSHNGISAHEIEQIIKEK